MAKEKQSARPVFMVRLKPYNPKRGIKLRRYVVFGHRFDEERGWYKVNEMITDLDSRTGQRKQVNLIEYLRDVRQNNEDQDSPKAFDVCTPEEAAKIDEAEEEATISRAKAADHIRGRSAHPNDLTSRETRGGSADDDSSARRRAAAMSGRASSAASAPDEEKFDEDADLGAKNE